MSGVNMEANKEAAQDCMDRGNDALRSMDLERALKWFRKSASLVPSDALSKRIAEVEQLQRNMSSGPVPKRTPAPTPPPPTPSAARSTAPPEDSRPFTDEQVQLVKKINKTKDYYDLLGLEKGADSSAVSSAYRKLAVKLHPDKNSAPGAVDAFKKVKSAYECLNDDNKRAHYDRFGSDQDEAPQPPPGAGGFGGHHEHQEFTAEELFSAFFGGPLPGARRRRAPAGHQQNFFHQHQQQQRNHQQQQPQNPLSGLLFLLPFLVIFLFSAMQSPSMDDPFSMQRTNMYSVERHTQMQNVQYFVMPQFSRTYGRDSRQIYEIDARVEAQYIRDLTAKCEVERSNYRRALSEAKKVRGPDGPEKLRKAHAYPRPSCDRIDSFYANGA